MSEQLQIASISAPGFFGLKSVDASMLVCSHCKKQKLSNEFPRATNKPRGFAWICKQCKKTKLLQKKASMSKDDWMLLNRKYWLKSQYNLSLEEYNEKLKNQEHKCAICRCDETEAFKGLLFVDHCHKTNKVRGLLCHHCNTALGKFRESKQILQKAMMYLDQNDG
jgi:hypothetical protein